MTGNRYCLCCNEDVPTNAFERGGNREIACSYCGFTVDVEAIHSEGLVREGCALVADDSKYTRKIIEEVLREQHPSSKVLTFENGRDLVAEYANVLAAGDQVLVAILDLNMPVMDGLTAARTMRALEVRYSRPGIPIVFFSGQKADDSLKGQMQLLEPANYMNKGSDPDPDKLASRVESLLAYVIERFVT